MLWKHSLVLKTFLIKIWSKANFCNYRSSLSKYLNYLKATLPCAGGAKLGSTIAWNAWRVCQHNAEPGHFTCTSVDLYPSLPSSLSKNFPISLFLTAQCLLPSRTTRDLSGNATCTGVRARVGGCAKAAQLWLHHRGSRLPVCSSGLVAPCAAAVWRCLNGLWAGAEL